MTSKRGSESVGHARRAWTRAGQDGMLDWLQDSTFIPASCFAPPIHSTHPRAWDRIAVPSARRDQQIYKRISAKPGVCVDKKYAAAVAELDSQGFGNRKLARPEAYVTPYGEALFDKENVDEHDSSGKGGLDAAREQVQGALQSISKDNLRLSNASLRRKPSTFDPVQLTWIPRKRHNTRWPVNPPHEGCDFIAKLQPLIRFELHPDQIDDPAFVEQSNVDPSSPLRMPLPAPLAEPTQQVQPQPQIQIQKQGRRRRTIRPSLSTISEALDEPPIYPLLTPNPKAQTDYLSPTKRGNGPNTPADKLKTPTKIAESPMKDFTLSVTHVPGRQEFGLTNSSGRFRVTSPTNTEATTAGDPVDQSPWKNFTITATPRGEDIETTNSDDHLCASSDVYPETTLTPALNSSGVFTRPAENMSTFHTALPFFDAPVVVGVQDEPEHECKRRISMDNARRNDRRPSVKIAKRVTHWIAGVNTSSDKKRRHSELPQDIEVSAYGKSSRRRHTLDVDVGRNLDIFGAQTATQQEITEERRDPNQFPRQSVVSDGHQTLQNQTFAKPNSSEPAIADPTFSKSILPLPISQPGNLTDYQEDLVVSEEEEVEQQLATEVDCMVEMDIAEEVGEIMDGIEDQIVNEIEDEIAGITPQHGEANTASVKQGEVLAPPTVLPQNEDIFMPANEEDLEGDSALADLHNFVRRAKSSKERNDVHTNMILPSSKFAVKKRRSGSMNSATSGTGSPMGKIEKATAIASVITTASPRVPLGQKDANRSPSPVKKRKLKGAGEDAPIIKKKHNRLVAPDLEDYDTEPAQPKKRRRKMEADTEDIFNPDIAFGQDLTKRASSSSSSAIITTTTPMADGPGSRRSSRIKKAAAATAIPVRFPSAGPPGTMLDDMPTVSTAAITNAVLTRKANKDLAAETRTNTQKNKSGAVEVAVALAAMATATANDAGEDEVTTTVESGPRPGGGAKSVRWAEILARVQGEEDAVVTAIGETVVGATNEVGEEKEKEDEDEESALPPPPQLRLAEEESSRPGNPVANQLTDEQQQEELGPEVECMSAKKKKKTTKTTGPAPAPTPTPAAAPPPPPPPPPPPRRSSRAAVSRLPTRSGGLAPAAATPAKKMQLSALPGPSSAAEVTTKARGGGGATGAAGARARLGMAGPGTPGPRRGGRRGGRRG